MEFSEILKVYTNSRGWNPSTQVELLCDYLDKGQITTAKSFIKFLNEIVASEESIGCTFDEANFEYPMTEADVECEKHWYLAIGVRHDESGEIHTFSHIVETDDPKKIPEILSEKNSAVDHDQILVIKNNSPCPIMCYYWTK